jgi:hypothetical protein
MGKGSTRGSVQHYRKLPDGSIGCYSLTCEAKATKWIDMERYGNRRFLSTAYCDEHGDQELNDPHHAMRVRRIAK